MARSVLKGYVTPEGHVEVWQTRWTGRGWVREHPEIGGRDCGFAVVDGVICHAGGDRPFTEADRFAIVRATGARFPSTAQQA